MPILADDGNQALPVTITVTDSFGTPVPHAQVRLAPHPASNPGNSETNETGRIVLNVLPGKYTLQVTAPKFKSWTKDIQAAAHGPQSVEVILQAADTSQVTICGPCPMVQIQEALIVPSGSVTFVIADATGATIPHAKIGVNHANIKDHPEEIVWKLNEADETGYFTLNLSPGIYDLAVTSPGFRLWTRQIEVKEKDNRILKVALEVGECPPGSCTVVESAH